MGRSRHASRKAALGVSTGRAVLLRNASSYLGWLARRASESQDEYGNQSEPYFHSYGTLRHSMNRIEAAMISSLHTIWLKAFDSGEELSMGNDANDPTILIVDDDASIREVLVEALREGGFVSKVASTGEEAIIQLNAGRFRALIIDVGFGSDHVKGWAVARRARAFDPSIPVIYITGGSKDDWSVEGVPNSVLLSKPFAPVQLLTALAQLLNVSSS